MNRTRLLMLVLFVLTALLTACAAPTPQVVGSPLQTVADFYVWLESYEGSLLGERGYRESPYLSPEYIQELDALVDSFEQQGGGAFDPFICAQDRPQHILVLEAEGTPELTRVTVEAWQPIYVDVRLVDWEWQIIAIHCTPPVEQANAPAAPAQPVLIETPAPTEEAATPAPTDAPAAAPPVAEIPADWLLFEDATLGFQLWYPADWETQKIPPMSGEVPDGERARKYTLLLQPQGWDGIAAPLSIQVTEGTDAQFAAFFLMPADVEEVLVNGNPAVKAVDVFGDMFIASTIIPHPANGEVRLVCQDMLSGFPARLAGHEAVSARIEQIIGTVTFE